MPGVSDGSTKQARVLERRFLSGTGKTHVINELGERFVEAKVGRVVATAFTGVAACAINGPTLLRLLSMQAESAKYETPKAYSSESDVQELRQRFRDESGVEWDDVALVVVDEHSFIDALLFGHLDVAWQPESNSKLSLAGIQLSAQVASPHRSARRTVRWNSHFAQRRLSAEEARRRQGVVR